MKIHFKVIPARRQRYKTVGDYFKQHGTWQFRVSKLRDPRYAQLVFIHELVEWLLTRVDGISGRKIDRFDMKYEEARAAGAKKAPCGCKFGEEPGDDVHAPYHKQHLAATIAEQAAAQAMKINWNKYERALGDL